MIVCSFFFFAPAREEPRTWDDILASNTSPAADPAGLAPPSPFASPPFASPPFATEVSGGEEELAGDDDDDEAASEAALARLTEKVAALSQINQQLEVQLQDEDGLPTTAAAGDLLPADVNTDPAYFADGRAAAARPTARPAANPDPRRVVSLHRPRRRHRAA